MSEMTPSALNLIDFPLSGFNLIEASAGTGKTYALANIYLRYLLERKCDVSEILVVTFTEAATQELRDRIRARIQALRCVFEGQATDDALLAQMAAQSSAPQEDLIRLRLAEREIDQAEIYTIHGFCQRLLQSTAWQLGAPLQQNLEEDLRPLREQCVADFWRQDVLALSHEALTYVRSHWRGPEGLSESLRVLLERRPARVLPEELNNLAEWQSYLVEFTQIIRELKEQSAEAIDWVTDLLAESDLKSLKNKLKWLADIKAWAQGQESVGLDLALPKYLFRFSSSGIEAEVKKGGKVPEHPWFDQLQQAQDALITLSQSLLSAGEYSPEQSLVMLKASFLRCASQAVLHRMADAKRARGMMGFDDLISQVAQALKNETLTAQLVSTIRQEYGAAMIDEFQDTDPEQYHIFSTLFVSESSNLVLIGDPKQAIYSFRGGDMETYLQAKRDVIQHPQGQLFGMDTNWRSSPQMVTAVNTLFTQHPRPFLSEDIPFISVGAAKESAKDWGPALRFQLYPALNPETEKAYSKAELDQSLADASAVQIAKLLASEGERSKGATSSNSGLGIKSSDIAILVRTSVQASLMQASLASVGIRASFEGKSSVYESPEALSVLLMLRMVLAPHDLAGVKQCLADPLLAFDDGELMAAVSDPLRLANLQARLEVLQQTWAQQGVLALVRQLVDQFDLLSRWTQAGDEDARQLERRLSNLTQLAELLQAQARLKPEPANLLNWYESILQDETAVNDQNRLRLESDEQLVQIVTIHKSKGLEYPIVFLPFMFSAKGAMDAWFYDQGQRCLDLLKSDDYKQEAEQARLAEDLRLLYVALTRSKQRCYVALTNYKSNSPQSLGLHKTALGCLLWGADQLPTKAIDEAAFSSRFEALRSEVLSVEALDFAPQGIEIRPSNLSDQPSQTDSDMRHRVFTRSLNQSWRVQSFSGLLYEHHQLSSHASHAGGSLSTRSRSQMGIKGGLGSGPTHDQSDGSDVTIFQFPRGSQAGTFLHELFESVHLENGTLIDTLRDRFPSDLSEADCLHMHIYQSLQKSHLVPDAQLDTWAGFLKNWLLQALNFAIPVSGSEVGDEAESEASATPIYVHLSDLKAGAYLSEMDFHFSLGELSPATLNRVLKQHGLSDEPIEFHRFRGHLKGAIDLVFEHQGRYYLLDYKSNYLGDSVADYHPDALKAAMADHRYDLQYLIYCLALHRHLKHRLGEAYRYEQHFGGAIYLFLRGMVFDDAAGSSVSESEPESRFHSGSASDAAIEHSASLGVYHSLPDARLIQTLDEALSS